jgi:hypothetical protein
VRIETLTLEVGIKWRLHVNGKRYKKQRDNQDNPEREVSNLSSTL